MVNTKGETSMLYVQAIVVQVEWCRQMGSLCNMTDTSVSSVVQIYLHQLMKCSIAAIGQCGKHCVTLNNKRIVSEILTQDWNGSFLSQLIKSILLCNFRGASPLTSTCEQYQSGQMSNVVNIVILVYLRGFESYLLN